MIHQMVLTFSIFVFICLVAGGYHFGVDVGVWYTLASLVLSPLLSFALVMAIAFLADWSERRARAKRLAKCRARKV